MLKCAINDYNISQLTKNELKHSSRFSKADIAFKINDLCNYVGITRQFYYQIVNNKKSPSLETALKIYKYLSNIGFDYLDFEDLFYIQED